MKTIKAKDLEGVFVLIVRDDPKYRKHVPIVRRHFRSVSNLCAEYAHRQIDIYFSGVFVAAKKANATKIVMDKEYTQKYSGEFYEVSL